MSGNPAQNQQIRLALYELKKRYGDFISVYRLLSATTDYETGAKTATKESFDTRAIVLPTSEIRRFVANLNFISSSKPFVSPGIHGWDQSQRGFIIDARDIPGFEFETEDWIVYRDQRYEVSFVEKLEFDTGWFVVAKAVKGSDPEQFIRLNVVDTLVVEQGVTE